MYCAWPYECGYGPHQFHRYFTCFKVTLGVLIHLLFIRLDGRGANYAEMRSEVLSPMLLPSRVAARGALP